MRKTFDLSVYLVTDPRLCAGLGLVETAMAAVQGGATIVQLRDPAADGRRLVEQARALVAALRPHGVPVIVNDRIDVALAADADGAHVGQDDIAAIDARAMLGPPAQISPTWLSASTCSCCGSTMRTAWPGCG